MNSFSGRSVFLREAMALLSLISIPCVLAVMPARAQQERRRPLRLMLGGSTPVTYASGTNYSDTAALIAVGASYDVKQGRENRAGGRGLVFGLYWNGGSTGNILGVNARYGGPGVCARYEQTSRFYYGAGIGLYRQRTPNYKWSGEFTDKDAVRNDTGGKLFVGYQGSGSFFVQIDATLLPEINGDNLSNAAILLGLRL
jgi:hypothetical protein